MQKIMKERKINPAAGCLPVLIQMPILFGFYHAISRMNVTYDIGNFLWFELGVPSITLAVLSRTYAICSTSYGTCNGQPTNENYDVHYAFMIMGFGSFLPAALALYWVIGNFISIIQNIFIYKPFKKKEEVPVKVGGKRK